MLRTIIISPDRELNLSLQKVLAETEECDVLRIADRYPGPMELSRTLRALAPHVIMLGDHSIEECLATAAQALRTMPGVQIVAVGREGAAETLIQVMRAGIREYLASPFPREVVRACLERAAQTLTKQPVSIPATDKVYSFLPAKPGAGATTLSLSGSAAAGSDSNRAETLLIDFDLNSGLLRFLLKLDATHSVLDALAHSQGLDEKIWPQLVTHVANLDVLHAGPLSPDLRVEATQVQHLLDFARRQYKLICIDLSGNLERYSLELMRESKCVFVVCTPEMPSLHLAREKVQYLNRQELGGRICVLLNRHHRRSEIQPQDVEKLVGAAVALTFPNEYVKVCSAVREGTAVDIDSELGRQCAALAELMLDRKLHAPYAKRRFADYFGLTPSRFSFDNRRT